VAAAVSRSTRSSSPLAAVRAGKAALRRTARATRDALPADERARAARAIAARLDADVFASLAPGVLIALYAGKGTEVDTAAAADLALARGLALAYPRVLPGQRRLAFHRVTPAELVHGTFGILEPAASAPEIDPATAAVVLLPGLAFDRHGTRLGWGQGHYDATFAGAAVLRVGVAYESQLVEHLPADEHDVPVHLIATEIALHRPGGPG
jgi:5-formyltetrahydrofolate cyclo-ligase